MTEREWLLAIRQILLNAVDLIERKLEIHPRTSEQRRLHKTADRDMLKE